MIKSSKNPDERSQRMDIQILNLIEGAKLARGITVIIDVFRAFSVEALTPTDEDTLCARYIKSLLENSPIDITKEIEKLRYTSGAKFFDPTQSEVFPEEDFYMCTKTDCFDFVLKLKKSEHEVSFMIKEKV